MKQELQKVIDKSTECLGDAKYLLEGKRYEAAVNRAYYAMFTAVMGLLLDKDIFVKTHSGLKSKFHEHFLKTNLLPVELGKIFENATSLRQDADYDFEIEVAREDAEQLIEDAEKFIRIVNDFLKQGQ